MTNLVTYSVNSGLLFLEQNFPQRISRTLFVRERRNLATFGIWPIETYSPNFVNFGPGSARDAATCISPSLIHFVKWFWFFDNFPMFADSFNVLSIHCVARGLGASFLYKSRASPIGSLRQHDLLVVMCSRSFFKNSMAHSNNIS